MIDNGGYGIIKQTQDTWLGSGHVAANPDSGLGFPESQKIASGYGIKTFELNNHGNPNGIISKVLSSNKGTTLCPPCNLMILSVHPVPAINVVRKEKNPFVTAKGLFVNYFRYEGNEEQ